MEMTTGLPACSRASSSARICSAAKALPRAVDPQHHGFDLSSRRASASRSEAVAADGAGRLDAIHDGAAGVMRPTSSCRSGEYCSGMAPDTLQTHPFPAVIVGSPTS